MCRIRVDMILQFSSFWRCWFIDMLWCKMMVCIFIPNIVGWLSFLVDVLYDSISDTCSDFYEITFHKDSVYVIICIFWLYSWVVGRHLQAVIHPGYFYMSTPLLFPIHSPSTSPRPSIVTASVELDSSLWRMHMGCWVWWVMYGFPCVLVSCILM